MRRILTALLLLGLLVVALPAAAQAVGAADACYEIDHSGDNDFGSPSVVRVFLTVPPEFAGTWVDLAADGASGSDATGPSLAEPTLVSTACSCSSEPAARMAAASLRRLSRASPRLLTEIGRAHV